MCLVSILVNGHLSYQLRVLSISGNLHSVMLKLQQIKAIHCTRYLNLTMLKRGLKKYEMEQLQ